MKDNEALVKELAASNEDLAQALFDQQKLKEELMEVNKKLNESEALKTHFLSNISNEIVNPFTAITGLASSLIKLGGQDPETMKRMISMILTEALHLDFQLKNIFMASAIEAGEVSPQFKITKISAIIKHIIESYALDLQQRNIQVEINIQADNDIEFITDPEKFDLIVLNLFNNAMLFSKNDSLIRIKVDKNEEELVVEITDNGVGMDENEINLIFNRFKRIENRINSINRGNGLGLSISKALVDILKGVIILKSKKNQGSVFTVRLPDPGIDALTGHNISESGNETLFGDNVIF